MARPTAQLIERLQRRRTAFTFVQAVFFAVWQASYLSLTPRDLDVLHTDNHVHVFSYVIWGVLLLTFIASGGGFIFDREIREVLNDETTREHRRRALAHGFWLAVAGAAGAFVWSLFAPITTVQALHVVLSAGIGAALFVFGFLERRAQADG
jgi:hypothetical protein